uniref:Uncharacterized protein n=1 Tax=Glossina pallidipes TaxID=7398 RepID=A0A1B0AJN1_GLOPL
MSARSSAKLAYDNVRCKFFAGKSVPISDSDSIDFITIDPDCSMEMKKMCFVCASWLYRQETVKYLPGNSLPFLQRQSSSKSPKKCIYLIQFCGHKSTWKRCSNDGHKSWPTMAITKSSISDGKLHNTKMVNESVGFIANIIIGDALVRLQAASPLCNLAQHPYHEVFLLVLILYNITEVFESFEREMVDLTSFSTSLYQLAVSNSLNLPCDIDDARFFTGNSVPICDSDSIDFITIDPVCSMEMLTSEQKLRSCSLKASLGFDNALIFASGQLSHLLVWLNCISPPDNLDSLLLTLLEELPLQSLFVE